MNFRLGSDMELFPPWFNSKGSPWHYYKSMKALHIKWPWVSPVWAAWCCWRGQSPFTDWQEHKFLDVSGFLRMDVELAPLRPLSDFLLEGARFQVPDIQDLERWANRIINNLLYYQSNYMLMAVLVFLLVGWVDSFWCQLWCSAWSEKKWEPLLSVKFCNPHSHRLMLIPHFCFFLLVGDKH